MITLTILFVLSLVAFGFLISIPVALFILMMAFFLAPIAIVIIVTLYAAGVI